MVEKLSMQEELKVEKEDLYRDSGSIPLSQ